MAGRQALTNGTTINITALGATVDVLTYEQLLTLSLLFLLVALVTWGRVGRHVVALVVLILLLTLGLVDPLEAVGYVDWDVIGLIIGMGVLTSFLEQAGVMESASLVLARAARSRFTLVFLLTVFSGLISTLLENVSVVLLYAPIALRLALSTGLNPRVLVVLVALASNMVGSATMVGDPQAIIVAGHYELGFMDFIVYDGRPSMFFFTIAPLFIACALSTSLYVRRLKPGVAHGVRDGGVVKDKAFFLEALLFLALKIVLLTMVRELGISLTAAAAAGAGGLIAVRALHEDYGSIKRALASGFDLRLLVFLATVFVISGAFVEHRLSEVFAEVISSVGGDFFVLTSLIIWLSVAVSAFIDNVPYVVTMLPVIDNLSRFSQTDPVLLAWALLLGATLGGNLTYIGASANLVAVRYLERHGHNMRLGEFVRISLFFNTVSVVSGWVMYELVWA